MKYIARIAAILSLTFLLTGCSEAASTTTPALDAQGVIHVVTSFNPVDQIVRTIGGAKVSTSVFVKPGTEPHDFEPSPKDMQKLGEASALFLNGLDMEHWAQDPDFAKSTPKIDLSQGITPISTGTEGTDPHIWLGLEETKIMAANALKALSSISPENKAFFEANYAQFIQEANAVQAAYGKKFEPYRGNAFVTGHEAFAYLCRNIGLNQVAVEGPFGEGEPTPQKIRELVDFVKANQIKTVFTETAASPKVSETLAKETGARLVEIPTMESAGEMLPTITAIYEAILASFE